MAIEEQYDKIYRYCFFKVHNRQLAEDITQEAFLRFFSKELNLESSKELPYLYTIARNLCIDEYRKIQTESLDVVADIQGYDPSEDWINSISLKSAISTLSKEEQEILLLRYANEVPISTICKVTGMSRFALYRKLTKVLKYLNAELVKGGFTNE